MLINIHGTERQALHLFDCGLESNLERDFYGPGRQKEVSEARKLQIIGPGGVRVRTRSWMDDVKGKFGLEHVQYKTCPDAG